MEKPRIIENSSGIKRVPGTRDLSSLLLNCDDTKFINFLYACLQYNPKDRLTPAQALQHPWLTEDFSLSLQDIHAISNSVIQEEDLIGQNQSFDLYEQQSYEQQPQQMEQNGETQSYYLSEHESYLEPNGLHNDFPIATMPPVKKKQSFDSYYSNLNHDNENQMESFSNHVSENFSSYGSNQFYQRDDMDDLSGSLNIGSSSELDANFSNNHTSIFEDKDFAKSMMSESDNEDQSDVLTQPDSPILTARSNNPQHSPSPNYFSRNSISVG